MKTLFSYSITIFIVLFSTFANAQSVTTGDNLVSISFGAGNFIRPQGFTTVLPPTIFHYERAVTNQITIGGYLGYSVSTFEDEGIFTIPYSPYKTEFQRYTWNSKNIVFGLKGAYHLGDLLNTSKRLDPYAALSLGYNANTTVRKQKEGSVDLEPKLSPDPSGRFMLGIYVGARYYFNEKIAVFGEFGYSTALLQLGFTYKIP